MAFKKTGNSRDDRSTNSSRRTSTGGPDKTNKTTSSSRPRSASAGPKKFDGETGSERKSFNKNFNKPTERSGDSFQGEKKFKGKPSGDFKKSPYGTKDFTDRPKRDGDFKSKAPYGTRDSGDSRPPREGGFKKASGDAPSFSRKPYGTRDSGDGKASREGGFKKEGSGYKGKTTAPGTDSRPFRTRKDDDTKKTNPYNREPKKGDTAKKPIRAAFDDSVPDRTMRGRKKATQDTDKGKIRLNRYISNAGICSRRKADELIVAGVVSVNGEVISELGFKVDPYKDEVRYNGETLKREKMVYVLLNKPKDYITTTDDPQERRTVMHLVDKASKERIYPVGRLDRNTTGLLLMTNDGDLADKLSHPKSNVSKLYHVELNKSLTQGDLNKIAYGVELEDGSIKPDSVSYVTGASKREVGIQIHSGKNRVVRRIFESLGYEVVKLDRAIYAGLTKKDLPRGRWRYLEEAEIIQLKHLIK